MSFTNNFGFLDKKSILDEISKNKLVDDYESGNLKECSYDLTIGKIVINEREHFWTRSKIREISSDFLLRPGHCALIMTKEKLNLGGRIGGIVFPPNHLSKDGLLVINQGHIDPKTYHHMTAVVINMGQNGYYLRPNETGILTALFFYITHEAKEGPDIKLDENRWEQLKNDFEEKMPADFLDITNRISSKVGEQIFKIMLSIFAGFAFFTFLLSLFSWFVPRLTDWSEKRIYTTRDQLNEMKAEISVLRQKIDALNKTADAHNQNISLSVPKMAESVKGKLK